MCPCTCRARGQVSSSAPFATREVPHSEVTGLPLEFTNLGQGQGSVLSCFGVEFVQRGAGGLSQSPRLLGSLAFILKLPGNWPSSKSSSNLRNRVKKPDILHSLSGAPGPRSSGPTWREDKGCEPAHPQLVACMLFQRSCPHSQGHQGQ